MAYALQNARIALQILNGTIALADNMRANANAWLAMLGGTLDGTPGNPTLSQIAGFMNGAAAAYSASITKAQTFGQNNLTLVQNALSLLGTTPSAVNSDLSALAAASTNLANADKTTVANAQSAANAILAAVPAAPSIF